MVNPRQTPSTDDAKRHQLTLEGVADVDAGRVVDHESVTIWATIEAIRAEFADMSPDEIQALVDEAITAVRKKQL